MKCLVAILVLAAVASAASIDTFRSWAKEHGKMYTAEEEQYRFAVFNENLAIIDRLNMENHGATFGPNKFTDLTNAEFKAIYTHELPIHQPGDFAVIKDNLKEELDMRNWLPAVKDQAQCGSCWAFSAVGNMEGAWFLKNKQVVSISEQHLVSCDKTDSGCNGGLMTNADTWVLSNKGIASEAEYPYTSGTGLVAACKTTAPKTYVFSSAKNLGKITADATIIADLKQYGPLSVAIEADKSVFQSYKSGVLDSTACGTTLDHGVTLVGFGTDASLGKDYWLVRNSWGKTWGEQGYIRMVRGKNMCGINGMISTIVA